MVITDKKIIFLEERKRTKKGKRTDILSNEELL